jgi:hypothetical protein
MNTKLGFAILAFAFALAFMFAAPKGTMAASENYNNNYSTDNLLGVDEALNPLGHHDRDRGAPVPDFSSDTRGLQGDWANER